MFLLEIYLDKIVGIIDGVRQSVSQSVSLSFLSTKEYWLACFLIIEKSFHFHWLVSIGAVLLRRRSAQRRRRNSR